MIFEENLSAFAKKIINIMWNNSQIINKRNLIIAVFWVNFQLLYQELNWYYTKVYALLKQDYSDCKPCETDLC